MPAFVTFDTDKTNGLIEQQLLPEVARAKMADLLEASYYNFRNRTGRLRASIRLHIVEGEIAVAIGTIILYYWQYVKDLTRGPGEVWILEAARYRLEDRFREAATRLGLT